MSCIFILFAMDLTSLFYKNKVNPTLSSALLLNGYIKYMSVESLMLLYSPHDFNGVAQSTRLHKRGY